MNEEDLFRAYGRPSLAAPPAAEHVPLASEVARERVGRQAEDEAFWAQVHRLPGLGSCWIWRGARRRDGYGIFRFDGETTPAHRKAWMLAHGPIPDGTIVRQDCRHRSCVRLDHLRPTTEERATGRRQPRSGIERRSDQTYREREFRDRRAAAIGSAIHDWPAPSPQVVHSRFVLSDEELSTGSISRYGDGSALGDDGEGVRLGRGYDVRTRETA